MATIYEPTTAEVLAAGYLYERDKALSALVVAFEAMNRMRECAEGKHVGSESEIVYALNEAQRTVEEAFLLCGEKTYGWAPWPPVRDDDPAPKGIVVVDTEHGYLLAEYLGRWTCEGTVKRWTPLPP